MVILVGHYGSYFSQNKGSCSPKVLGMRRATLHQLLQRCMQILLSALFMNCVFLTVREWHFV